ncbi:MAG: MATE family efflux transporter, partial [Synergistaceae bacterium]|nr:MATE family efflux transporter [Synergistaceae bacterium]
MEYSQKYDLTRGGIIDRLLLVALPIIGTQLLMMSYNLVDMFLLGRVGSEAVAASGIAGMYVWMSEGFLLIGKMGAEIGVSQSLGRRDEAGAKK